MPFGLEKKLDHRVINKCEELIWGENHKEIKSNIMSPIYLNGQVIGNAFITNKNQFNYYDYLRFLQLIKEFTATSLKDAKRYEFLAKVIQFLPDKNFDVVLSIFENLHVLFSISGACLRDKRRCYNFVFTSSSSTSLPKWQKNECFCSLPQITNEDGIQILTSLEICSKLKELSKFLGIKSGLRFAKKFAKNEKEDVEFEFILYFNFLPELLSMNKKQLSLEIEDALELTVLAEKNLEFYKAYSHDTSRFISDFNTKDKLKEVMRNRTELMEKLAGDKLEPKEIINISVNEFKDRVRNLYNIQRQARKSTDPFIQCPRFYINIKDFFCNMYWPAIENILNNLIKNSLKNKDEKTAKQTILLRIYEDIDYLIMEYSQRGENFKFIASVEDIQRWLIGQYESNRRGFGHYIIQITMDRFHGQLVIILERGRESFIITKEEIRPLENEITVEKEKITYKMRFPKNWKDM